MTYTIKNAGGEVVAGDDVLDESTKLAAFDIGGTIVDDADGSIVYDSASAPDLTSPNM